VTPKNVATNDEDDAVVYDDAGASVESLDACIVQLLGL